MLLSPGFCTAPCSFPKSYCSFVNNLPNSLQITQFECPLCPQGLCLTRYSKLYFVQYFQKLCGVLFLFRRPQEGCGCVCSIEFLLFELENRPLGKETRVALCFSSAQESTVF